MSRVNHPPLGGTKMITQPSPTININMRTPIRPHGSDHLGPRPVGTTTRARLTLLDAWSDANETSHGRSLPLRKVLAARSSVPQPFL
jgi:hypothetical protein